jgi:hypothetical protein
MLPKLIPNVIPEPAATHLLLQFYNQLFSRLLSCLCLQMLFLIGDRKAG